MQYTIGTCSNCSNTKPIVNKKYFVCNECNQIRLHGKIKRYELPKPKSGIKTSTKVRKSNSGAKNSPKHKITYYCSDGTKVTQDQIDKHRSKSYSIVYPNQIQQCQGCGEKAQGSAHIVPQARCKQIHKTELIWELDKFRKPVNFFPACHKCNAAIENPKGDDWKYLDNIGECLAAMKEHDEELYNKFVVHL